MMKKTNIVKRIVTIFALVGLILTIPTGCSKNVPTTSQITSSMPAEKVTIKLYCPDFSNIVNVQGYEDRTKNPGDFFKVIGEEFTKENPNIQVDVTVLNVASSGNTQQLDVDIASGDIPDVYVDDSSRTSKYMGRGMGEDISADITKDRTDFIKGMIPDSGPVYELPLGFNPYIIAVNKSIFEKAGALDLLPKADSREWTIDEFLKALKAVSNPPTTYGTILWAKTVSGDRCTLGFLWGFGARFFKTGDYSKTTLNSPEGLKGVSFLNQLVKDGLAVPAPAALTDDDMWAMWQKQQIALTGGYSYLVTLAKDSIAKGMSSAPFDVYFVNYPHDQGQPNTPICCGINSVCIFKQADATKRAASIKLLEYISSGEWDFDYINKMAIYPARKSVQPLMSLSEEDKALLNLVDNDGTIDFATFTNSQYANIRDKYSLMMQQVYTNAKTPEAALKDFEDAVNKLLAGK